ncbi:MAG: hypothetical protein P4N60_15845 [Verrucomicrobiae bacterium]|nr:hypothetical protein [Verrucomicrobiae bacterium]
MIPENSNEEINALKNQVFSLLIALIVISGTMMVTLYRQTSMAGKDIAQAEQAEHNLQQVQGNMNAFVNKLVAYGEKHPDFAASVLKKYGIAPVPGIPAGSPAGAIPKK